MKYNMGSLSRMNECDFCILTLVSGLVSALVSPLLLKHIIVAKYDM